MRGVCPVMLNDEVLNEFGQRLWPILDMFNEPVQILISHLCERLIHQIITVDKFLGNDLAGIAAVIEDVLHARWIGDGPTHLCLWRREAAQDLNSFSSSDT